MLRCCQLSGSHRSSIAANVAPSTDSDNMLKPNPLTRSRGQSCPISLVSGTMNHAIMQDEICATAVVL
jgi:hypothetical protein